MYFTDCVVNTFLWDVFLRLCVCIRCQLRREVPFKLIFIRYNIEPLGVLVFFLNLRARGMRKRWRRRRTRRSPSLLFTWLLTSLLSSSRWRTRLGRRGCATSFPYLSFLERYAPFWTRISLDNSLLCFLVMIAVLLTFLIASFALYILAINLCHSLRSLCKGVKSWKRRMRVWTPLLYCYGTGRMQYSIETEILWNKIVNCWKWKKKLTQVKKFASPMFQKGSKRGFNKIYLKYTFLRTSINNWKFKIKNGKEGKTIFKRKKGRRNLVSDDLISKAKIITIGTRAVETAINCRIVMVIGNRMVKSNNLILL